MRALTGQRELERFMKALGDTVRATTHVYLVGGASAVLMGWRDTTIDIDLTFVPDADEMYRAIARLKDELNINIELAAPDHFIPPVPGWQERSPFIARHGAVSFHHYDFYAQALAKIERGHDTDRRDVRAMIDRGLVNATTLGEKFQDIVPQLYRYPSVDAEAFGEAVADVVRNH